MENPIIRYCKVISVDDTDGGQRIKVRIDGHDNYTEYPTTKDLPYCNPLLPKMLHIVPKVGECVLVIMQKINTNAQVTTADRWYIGPLISQDYFFKKELYDVSAKTFLKSGSKYSPLPNPDRNADNNGTMPNIGDLAIRGRGNNDIIFKDDELQLRSGIQKNKGNNYKTKLNFNNFDLGYIQMKYKQQGLKDNKGNDFNSNINIVADRINLLSYDGIPYFNLLDPKKKNDDTNNLITDGELLKILEQAHQLPYGDVLVSFLKQFIDVFRRHTHPFSMLPPTFNQVDTDLLNTDLNKCLSNTIRIN